MIALSVTAVLVAATSPYALLFLLPSLHAWLWAPHFRDARFPSRVLLYAAGFAGPLTLVIAYAVRLRLGFDAPWYLATLFTVGYAPVAQIAALLLWGAAAGQVGATLFGRYAPYPTEGERPVRGAVRESVRLTVLLARRVRRGRPTRGPEGWQPEEPIQRSKRDAVPR
jgi:hypothetical protein